MQTSHTAEQRRLYVARVIMFAVLFVFGCGKSDPQRTAQMTPRTSVSPEATVPEADVPTASEANATTESVDTADQTKIEESANPVPSGDILRFDATGSTVAYVGASKAIGVFDIAKQKSGRAFYFAGTDPCALDVSADAVVIADHDGYIRQAGRVIPTGLDDYRKLQNAASEQRMRARPTAGRITAIAADPASNATFIGSDLGELVVWQPELAMDTEDAISGFTGGVTELAITSDGRGLAAITNAGQLAGWDVGRRGAPIFSKQLPSKPTALAFGAEGETIAVLESGAVIAVQQDKARALGNLESGVVTKAIKPLRKGQDVLAIGDDGAARLLVAGQSAIKRFPTASPPGQLFLSQAENQISVLSLSKAKKLSQLDVYRLSDGKPQRRVVAPHNLDITASLVSEAWTGMGHPDGTTYWFAGNQGKPSGYVSVLGGAVEKLVRLPDGNRFFYQTKGGLGVAPIPDGKATQFPGQEDTRLRLVAVSPDGSKMVGVLADTGVLVYKASDSLEFTELTPAGGSVSAVAIRDDGLIVLGTRSGILGAVNPMQLPASIKIIDSIKFSSEVTAVGVDPAGLLFAAEQSGTIAIGPLRERLLDAANAWSLPSALTAISDFALQDSIIAADGRGQMFRIAPSNQFKPVAIGLSVAGGCKKLFLVAPDRLGAVTQGGEVVVAGIEESSVPSIWKKVGKDQLIDAEFMGSQGVFVSSSGECLKVDHAALSTVKSRSLNVSKLASVAWDEKNSSVVTSDGSSLSFRAAGETFTAAAEQGDPFATVGVSADSRYFHAVTNSGKLTVWSREDTQNPVHTEENVLAAKLQGSSMVIARQGGQVVRRTIASPVGDEERLRDMASRVTCFASTTSGDELIAGASDGTVYIRKPDGTGEQIEPVVPGVAVTCIAAGANSIVTGLANGQLWSLDRKANAKTMLPPRSNDPITSVSLADDVKFPLYIAGTSRGALLFWCPSLNLLGEKQVAKTPILWSAFDPSRRLVQASTLSGSVLDVVSPSVERLFDATARITHVSRAAETGSVLLASLTKGVLRLDANNANAPTPIAGAAGGTRKLSITADGGCNFLIAEDGQLFLLPRSSSSFKASGSQLSNADAVVLAATESQFYIRDQKALRLVNPSSGSSANVAMPQEVKAYIEDGGSLPSQILHIGDRYAFVDSEGRSIAVASEGVGVESRPATSAESQVIDATSIGLNNHGVIAITPGGDAVVFTSGTSQTLPVSAEPCIAAAVAPGGKRFATAHNERTIKVWDGVQREAFRLKLEDLSGEIESLAFDADGQSLAARTRDAIAFIDLNDKRLKSWQVLPQASGPIVSFGPTGLIFLDTQAKLKRLAGQTNDWFVAFPESDEIVDVEVDVANLEAWAVTEGDSLVNVSLVDGERIGDDSRLPASPVDLDVATSSKTVRVLLTGNQIWSRRNGTSDLSTIDHDRQLKQLSLSGDGGRGLVIDTEGHLTNVKFQPSGKIESEPFSKAFTVQDARFLSDEQLLLAAKDVNAVVVHPLKDNVLGRTATEPIKSASVLPDESRFIAVNGTDSIEVVALDGSENKILKADGCSLDVVQVDPQGLRFAAAGVNLESGQSSHVLTIWELIDHRKVATIPLSSKATSIRYSPNGEFVAVGANGDTVTVLSAKTGQLIEACVFEAPVTAFDYQVDGKGLWAALKNGRISPYKFQVKQRIEAANKPITFVQFIGGGIVLTGDLAGGLSFWQTTPTVTPLAKLDGPGGPVRDAYVSRNGSKLVVVFGDKKNSVLVWEAGVLKNGASKPIFEISSPVRSRCVVIDDSGRLVVLGGDDGLIRVLDAQDGIEKVRFTGHRGPVADLVADSDFSRVTSGGSDHSLRIWKLPQEIMPGSAVSQPLPSDQQPLNHEQEIVIPPIEVPASSSLAAADAPDGQNRGWPPVPAWLAKDASAAGSVMMIPSSNDSSGTMIPDAPSIVVDAPAYRPPRSSDEEPTLLQDMNKARVSSALEETFGKVKLAELAFATAGDSTSDRPPSPESVEELSFLRNEFAKQRQEYMRQGSKVDFASDIENLMISFETEFDFTEPVFRPVKLCFTVDGLLYAARRSSLDQQTPGWMESWDFKYSGQKVNRWSDLRLNIMDLINTPDNLGVLTVPDLALFTKEGVSNNVFAGSRWAISDNSLLVIGTAGSSKKDEDVLRIFDVKDVSSFLKDDATPKCAFSSYEGVVTAMAFAHRDRRIAFAVRERNQHRVFIADADHFIPGDFRLVSEHKHSAPWFTTSDQQDAPKLGVTSLAFSEDDNELVSHGIYDDGFYQFVGWDLGDKRSSRNRSPESEESSVFLKIRAEDSRVPLMVESSPRSLLFLKDVARQSRNSTISRLKDPLLALVEIEQGLGVFDFRSQKLIHALSIDRSQWNQKIFSVASDGKWAIVGADNGRAYVWNALTNEKVSVTIDGRPAHSGPVVGVALSEPNPVTRCPEFAATVGEENQIRVWNLLPLLSLAKARSRN